MNELYAMQDVPIQMIVAMDAAGGIGKDGKLPWPKHPEDMKFFQETTKDSVVVMGRKTFEEIEQLNNQRETPCPTLLSNRKCVVLSSENVKSNSEIFVEKSLSNIVKYHFNSEKNLFVIGGLQLYMEALPWVNTIHATVFDEHYSCDRYLPLKYLMTSFDIVKGRQSNGAHFLTLQRVR